MLSVRQVTAAALLTNALGSSIQIKSLDDLGCSDSYFYDTTSFSCKPCGANAI